MKRQATVTTRGRVAIPREIRRRMGVKAGDKLEFKDKGNRVRMTAVYRQSVFEKYRGIGNPGIGNGRNAVIKWLGEMRGRENDE